MLGAINEGEVLAGKYRVERVLGQGGMGVVVAAHHIHLDERVAIKFLLPEMLGNAEAVHRFMREARAAVKIKSEHVARVSDVGTLETGAPYMVMEYLEGGDLAGWLRDKGALPVEQAVEFVLQACEAIAEAHAIGIVHRDLKPANLFVIRRPHGALSVKVLDFGISKMRGTGSSVQDVSITKTSAMMGSPLYMSPEQMQSAKDVDSRTDVWALGVILYELVTGVSPFMAEAVPELVAKILSGPPPQLSSTRPDAPAGLEAAIFKCLEKDPRKRFESVGELAAALMPFAPKRSRISLERISGVMQAAGLSSSAVAASHSHLTETGATARTDAAWERTQPPASRVKVALVLGVAVLLLGGVAGAVLWSRDEGQRVEASASAEPSAPSTAVARPPVIEPALSAAGAVASTAPSSGSPVVSASPTVSARPAAAAARPRKSGGRPAAKSGSDAWGDMK